MEREVVEGKPHSWEAPPSGSLGHGVGGRAGSLNSKNCLHVALCSGVASMAMLGEVALLPSAGDGLGLWGS